MSKWVREPTEAEFGRLRRGGYVWSLDASGVASRCYILLTSPTSVSESSRVQLRDGGPSGRLLQSVVLSSVEGVWCSSAAHDAEWTSVQIRSKSQRVVLCTATATRDVDEIDVATLGAAVSTLAFAQGVPPRRVLRRLLLSELRRAPDAQTLANVELALKHGVIANVVGDDGFSALITAAWGGNAGAVRLLLEHGAIVDAGASTPSPGALHAAASRGCAGSTEALLLAGADPLRVDARASTALHYCVAFSQEQSPSGGEHAAVAALLCDTALEMVGAADEDGETALEIALRIGNTGLAALLRGFGATARSDSDGAAATK